MTSTYKPTTAEIISEKKQTAEKNEISTNLQAIMKKMSLASASNPMAKDDNETLRKGLVVIMNKLRHEDKAIRKEALFALKQSRAQIQTLEDGAFSNKKHIVDGMDHVIKASEQGSLALIGLTKEVENRFLKAMPTATGFFKAFIRNSNPMFTAALNVIGDIKGLYKEGAKMAQDMQTAAIKESGDALDATLQSEKDAADVATVAAKENLVALKEIDSSQNDTLKELQRNTREITSVKHVANAQSKVLAELLRVWDSESEVSKAVLAQLTAATNNSDLSTLVDYVAGIKEGITAEATENGMDKEVVSSILRGIDLEFGSVLTQIQVASEEDRERFIQSFNKSLTSQIAGDDKAAEQSRNVLLDIKDEMAKNNELVRDGNAIAQQEKLKGSTKKTLSGKAGDAGGASPLADKAKSGIMGVFSGLFGSVMGIFSEIVIGVTSMGMFGKKILGMFGIVSKEAVVVAKVADGVVDGVAKASKGMSFFGRIVGAFGSLLKVVGKASGIITVVMALMDFFSGFSNADEILGKSKDSLTLWDKISSGIGSVFGGLLGIFDDIGGLMGFETGWSKDATKMIAKTLAAIPSTVMELFNSTKAAVIKYTSLDFWKDKILGVFDDMQKSIVEYFKKYTSADYWGDKIVKGLNYILSLPDMLFESMNSIAKDMLAKAVKMLPEGMIPESLKAFIASPTPGRQPAAVAPTPGVSPTNVSPSMNRAVVVDTMKQQDRDLQKLAFAPPAKPSSPVINAPSSNTVNAGTTIHNQAPLTTKTDDPSVNQLGNYAWAI